MEIILNTFGSSLNWDNGGFVVTNQAGRKRIPLADIQSIILTKGVSITSDAVLKAIENEIEIHFFDRKGTPQGVVWSNRFGSISTIRKGQLAFCRSSSAVTWIKDVVMRKVENQQALLLMTTAGMQGERSDISLAIERLEKTRATIAALQGERVQDVAHQLRGIEGSASKTYFAALNLALPQRYRFVERSQHPARFSA